MIEARNVLRVCIWPQYFSITYWNPRVGQLQGFDIDLAHELGRTLGVPVRFTETSFAEFMDRLEMDDCDIAMFGIGITAERAERIHFATPILSSPIYAVTTQVNPRIHDWEDIDRDGNVVAVAAGTYMEPFMRQTLTRATLLVVHPPRTREAELESGRADVFMSDYPYTRRLVAMHNWARVIEPPGPVGLTEYAWAVAGGDPAWLAYVNAFAERVRQDGTLHEVARRHGLEAIVLPSPPSSARPR